MEKYGRFYKYLKDFKRPHPWVLEPYGKGCAGGCKYCYAKTILESWGNWHGNEPSVADMKQIRYSLRHRFKPGDWVRIGSLSDAFQPIEGRYNLTEMIVEDCVRLGLNHLLVTKFARVASDEMLSFYDRDLSHFQISLTSTDDDFARSYEIGASSVSERVGSVERLHEHGYDVSIRLSPLVIDFVDNGKLDVKRLWDVDCDTVRIEFLRANGRIRKTFADFSDMSRYTLKDGVFYNLPLETKKEYVERLLEYKPARKRLTIAETIPAHWEFWRDHYDVQNGCFK